MSVPSTRMDSAVSDGVDTVAEALTRALRFGVEAIDAMRSGVRARASAVPSCGCDIPPPCWYPKPAGEVSSHVCPGGTATVRIRVVNCGPEARTVHIESAGDVKVDPPSLEIAPMEAKVSVLSVAVAATETTGAGETHLVWIRGCHDHYLRWDVGVARRGADSCHELDVEDCPDNVHHWYDHFYCDRPCFGRGDAHG